MKEGLPSRLLAMVIFAIFEVSLTASKQVYIVENGGNITQVQIFLPLVISSFLGTFWIFMAYIAAANIFHYVGRDIFGRKKKSNQPIIVPSPVQRA